MITINSWKLKYLNNVLIHDLVIVSSSMELNIAIKHIQTVLATGNHKRNIGKSCNDITCCLTKSCLLNNLFIENFSWWDFILRIFCHFFIFIIDLFIILVSFQSSFCIFFSFFYFVFFFNFLIVVFE